MSGCCASVKNVIKCERKEVSPIMVNANGSLVSLLDSL